jgi:hypothetical protein
MFEDVDLGIDCDSCGRNLRVTIADVAADRTKMCVCGTTVRLHDEGGGANRATRANRDLEGQLQRLDRSLNFKL